MADPTPGSTIATHEAIANEHGHVWWGWWKKQSEAVPLELWARIRTRGQAGSATVFLLDSGRRTLFEADLLDVVAEVGGGDISAPEEGALTPDYYRASRFATWFKLSRFRAVDATTLSNFAYERCPHDDLVLVKPEDVVHHRIGGIAQLLIFGNVTYWVAEPATEGAAFAPDPRTRAPLPAIAFQEVVVASSTRILHISDLHFGENVHAFERRGGDAFHRGLAPAVAEAFRDAPPALVVVTGDLTWTGSAEEFAEARECLDDLRRRFGITRDHFVIVPGNHDLQWSTLAADRREYDRTARVEVAPEQAIRNYSTFWREWYDKPPSNHLWIGRRYFLSGGPTLDILGLNSSALGQIRDSFAGVGCVTRAALQEAAGRFEWTKTRATQVRVVALHHHLLPVASQERVADAARGFGVAIDAEDVLLELSALGVDLVLHGHQHHPYLGFTWRERAVGEPLRAKRPILVLGCGSAGVVDLHLGAIRQRCFHLIDLALDGVSVETFTTSQAPTAFTRAAVARARWGDRWVRQDTA